MVAADWEKLADMETIGKTMKALATRGIKTEFVKSREDALEMLKNIIPGGAEVMTGGSTTLEQIGFVGLLKSGKHPWKNMKDEILAEKDPARQGELRKKSVSAQYFLGSVHAVAETGEVVVASATGSQIPSYAFTSQNVIWVVGAQKIVSDVDAGLKRVCEHSFPLEDRRMKSIGFPGSTIGKILLFFRETMERNITLIFVNEKLGF